MAVYGATAQKGKWYPKNPEKYRGDVNNIVYRSSWEKKMLIWLDLNPSVIEYASEEIQIPYFDPVQNKMRRYFVDLWAIIKTKDGSLKKFLIEIKPKQFTMPPPNQNRKTKRYIEEALQYATNKAKWEAAEKVCRENDMQFLLLTEEQIYGKK